MKARILTIWTVGVAVIMWSQIVLGAPQEGKLHAEDTAFRPPAHLSHPPPRGKPPRGGGHFPPPRPNPHWNAHLKSAGHINDQMNPLHVLTEIQPELYTFHDSLAKSGSTNDPALQFALGDIHAAISLSRNQLENSVPLGEMGIHNNLGVFYNAIGNIDSALYFLNIANTINYKGSDSQLLKALIMGNLGRSHFEEGDYEIAIAHIKKSVVLSQRNRRFINLIENFNLLSRCYVEMGDAENAKVYSDSTAYYIFGRPASPGPGSNKFWFTRSKVYDLMGDSDSAYYFLKVYHSEMEVTSQRRRSEAVMRNQAIAKIKDSEDRLKRSTSDVALERTRVLFFAVTSILLLLLALILYLNYRNKSKREKVLLQSSFKIEEQKNLIEKSLVEKEVLLQEVHHRVKNNLQLVSSLLELQSDYFDDAKMQEAMEEGQMRIKAMSIIHQRLYEENYVSEIPLLEYLNDLVEMIKLSYQHVLEKVNVEISGVDRTFDLATAIPLGLIANELLSNSYKYAFDTVENPKLTIEIKEINATEYVLIVRDNGKGLPQDHEHSSTSSLGLKLVDMLSGQLRGTCEYNFDNGAVFTVSFNVENKIKEER